MRGFRAAAAAALTLVCSCVPVPHRHTQRPALDIRVVDGAGNAIPTARVVLYRGAYLVSPMERFFAAPAREDGAIRVEGLSSWHMVFIAIPDAEAPWKWAWCVEAPGYRTEWRSDDSDESSGPLPLIRQAPADRCPAGVANDAHLAALRAHRDTIGR